jgi:hypothetical protein
MRKISALDRHSRNARKTRQGIIGQRMGFHRVTDTTGEPIDLTITHFANISGPYKDLMQKAAKEAAKPAQAVAPYLRRQRCDDVGRSASGCTLCIHF